MFWNPGAVLMLAILVGVTGLVLKSLMVTWHRINRGEASAGKIAEMEERLRKVESATTSLLIDVTSMREKERFMAKLQAGAAPRETPKPAVQPDDSGISPMITQSIPIIPRARSPRV